MDSQIRVEVLTVDGRRRTAAFASAQEAMFCALAWCQSAARDLGRADAWRALQVEYGRLDNLQCAYGGSDLRCARMFIESAERRALIADGSVRRVLQKSAPAAGAPRGPATV